MKWEEGGGKMEKSLTGRDVGLDCGFVACAKTEEEIFQKIAEHAQTRHQMTLSKEKMEKARSLIIEGC